MGLHGNQAAGTPEAACQSSALKCSCGKRSLSVIPISSRHEVSHAPNARTDGRAGTGRQKRPAEAYVREVPVSSSITNVPIYFAILYCRSACETVSVGHSFSGPRRAFGLSSIIAVREDWYQQWAPPIRTPFLRSVVPSPYLSYSHTREKLLTFQKSAEHSDFQKARPAEC